MATLFSVTTTHFQSPLTLFWSCYTWNDWRGNDDLVLAKDVHSSPLLKHDTYFTVSCKLVEGNFHKY